MTDQMPTREQLAEARKKMRENMPSRLNDIDGYLQPNDWQPTTPENLPYGEVVEVRWQVGDIMRMSPCIESGVEYWYAEPDGPMYWLGGTEWRYPVGVDKDAGG